MVPSPVYCNTCGAANRAQAVFFACGQPLHTAAAPPPSYPGATRTTQPTSSTTGHLPQDHLLKQRYRIQAQVGKGGFGAVYKAEDTEFSNRLGLGRNGGIVGLLFDSLQYICYSVSYEAEESLSLSVLSD